MYTNIYINILTICYAGSSAQPYNVFPIFFRFVNSFGLSIRIQHPAHKLNHSHKRMNEHTYVSTKIVFLLMRRFILLNLNFEWYHCSIEYIGTWHRHTKRTRIVQVFSFAFLVLFFSLLSLVCLLFTTYFSFHQPMPLRFPLPVCRCRSRCFVLLG